MQGAGEHEPEAVIAHDDRYRNWLVAIAKRKLGSEHAADEVVADMFTEIHLKSRTLEFVLKPEGMWRSYLLKMVASRCVDYQRKAGRRREVAWPENDFDLVGSEDTNAETKAEQLAQVARFVATLSKCCRNVFELRCDGVPSKQVAQELGIPVREVHRRYSQAKMALKRCVEGN